MESSRMSGTLFLALATYFVAHWNPRSSEAGIIALKFQNLWTLKQALIASKLPIAQQFVLLPSLTITNATITARPSTAATTTRPATTLASTARPPTVTTPRANVTPPATTLTTLRPNTIISIQQLFPGGQYGQFQYPPETIYFPGGALPGQSTGISSFPQGSFGGGVSGGQFGVIPGQGTIIPGQQQPFPGGGDINGSGGQIAFPGYPSNTGQQIPLSQSPLGPPPQSPLVPGQNYGQVGQLPYPPNTGLPAGAIPGQFLIPGGGIAKYARSAG